MSAPAIYTFPDNASLQEIERERSRVIDLNTKGSRIFPFTTEDADNVLWEIRDDVKGLLFTRNAEEPYPIRQDTGVTRFMIMPGRFGEQINMSEQKIERMRKVGTFAEPIDVGPELSRMAEDIAIREASTIEYIRWTLAATGVVTVATKDGTPMEIGRYTPQSYTPSVPWSTTATATPLNDMRIIRDTYAGHGHDFGFKAEAYATSVTLNSLLRNTNVLDIAGKRRIGQSNILSIDDYNVYLAAGENVAKLVSVDDGYLDSSGVFRRFIPEGKIVVVGSHWAYGLQAGEYVSTRNGSNNGQPGIYAEAGLNPLPPKLPWFARGHNGAPRIRYTRQIVVMSVYTP